MFKPLLAAVLLTALITPMAQAADKCMLFRDRNYSGEWITMTPDQWMHDFKQLVNGDWNDEVSSAKAFGRCQLYLYEDKNYRGWMWFVTFGDPNMVGRNDEVSSAKCICH